MDSPEKMNYHVVHRYLHDRLERLSPESDPHEIAFLLEEAATFAAAEGFAEKAAELFGAAEAIREKIGEPVPHSVQADYEETLTSARAPLGEEAFAVAWELGRRMSVEEAIQFAVQVEEESESPPGRGKPDIPE